MTDVSLAVIDLPRHLEWSGRLETILNPGQRYDIPLPGWEVENLKPYIQVMDIQQDVMAFIELSKWAVGILEDFDAYWRIAYEGLVDAFIYWETAASNPSSAFTHMAHR